MFSLNAKKWKKIFICSMLMAMGISLFSPLIVHAEVNETTTVTNYAIFDWVEHTDFINSNYAENTPVITTIEGRTVRVDILGAQAFPRASSAKELLGGGFSIDGGSGIEKEIIFSDFQQNARGLYIDEVKIGAYAVYNDGSYAPLTIYKNGYYAVSPSVGYGGYWCENDGEVCDASDVVKKYTPTASNPIISLNNLDLSYDSLLLRFDNPSNIKRYYFTYFQITKYRTMDIVGWTTDPDDPLTGYSESAYVDKSVKKVSTYTTTIGTFNPDFSKNDPSDDEPKWVDSINTSFNAGVDGLFAYPEVLQKTTNYNDSGRNGTSTKDSSTPVGMSTGGSDYEAFVSSANGGFDLVNAKWNCQSFGTSYYCEAEAYNSDKSQKTTAEYYARHWDGNSSGTLTGEENSISSDSSWCSHVNAGAVPCYKHDGRAGNTVWDGSTRVWDIISDDEKYVTGATYYYQKYSNLGGTIPVGTLTKVGNEVSMLTNANGTKVSNPVSGDDIASIVNIYDEGVFKVYAKVEANLNKEVTVESSYFYIDKTSPETGFDTEETDVWYTDTDLPVITANITDNLSGINTVQVMRYKSKDGINWVSDGTYNTVYDLGEKDRTVRSDALTNKDVDINLSASTGYLYYKVKVIATDVAGNSYDTISPIYKYDAAPFISYKLQPVRYYDEFKDQLNWTNNDVVVTFSVGDTESGLSKLQITEGPDYNRNVIAEVKEWTEYNINDEGFFVGSQFSDTVLYTQQTRITEDMNYYVHVVDKNGHITTIPYIVDHIDKQAPTVTWGTVDGTSWNKGSLPDITATIKDDLSGVDLGNVKRYKSINGIDWIEMSTEDNKVVWDNNTVSVSYDNPLRDDLESSVVIHMTPEQGYLYYKAELEVTDIAGNTKKYESPVIKYDEIPNISYTLNPPRLKEDNTTNWVNTDVEVNITLTDDEVGVQAVCLAQGTSWSDCITVIQEWDTDNYHEDLSVTATFTEDTRTLEQDGLYLVVKDKIGNTNSTPYIVDHIDKVPPVANFTPDGYGPGKGPIDVTITVDDVPMQPDGAKSEVKEWSYCVSTDSGVTWDCNEGLTTPEATVTITETGYNIIKVTVTDNAGNTTVTESGNYIIIGNPPTLIAKTDYWWVGDPTDLQQVLDNAEAISETDGVISDQIIITRITYQDGEIVDYPDKFRTDIAQSFVAEFEVTDSNGFTTRASQVYQVIAKEQPAPETPNDSEYGNVVIYQRYIDKYKIAIQDGSYWNVKEDYREALDEALSNVDAKDFEILTRTQD